MVISRWLLTSRPWRVIPRAPFSALPPDPPPPPPRPPTNRLMAFAPILWPSFVLSCKNWIYTLFIIKPHLDRDFNLMQFVETSKQAVEVISTALGESDFHSLRELVSEDAYAELYHSVTQMSVAERENLFIRKEDIYLSFPYQIGIIFEGDDRRWVEITMVYHAYRGLKELKAKEEPMSFGPHTSDEHQTNMYICNYRFIREYSKGITDSSWLVNIVNHFKELDFRKR